MKKILAIFIMLLIAATLFASGSKETGEDSKVDLRFSWWGGDSRHEGTLAAIALYEERNPNVSIEAEYGGWDGYYQKLVTQMAGAAAADIIQIDQPWLYELSSRGDSFLTLSGDTNIDISDFDAKFLKEFCSYEGSIKGLPTGFNGEVFLLDKAVLNEFGIPENTIWDWDSIVSMGAKINAANEDKYMLNIAPDSFTFFLEKYLSQKGGAVINADKSLGFTKSDAVEAFTYFQSWIDQKIVPPFSEIVLYNRKAEENPAWLNSHMASALSWTSNIDKIRGEKANTMITSLPVMEGSKNTGIMVRPSQILTVSSNSEYKEEAVKFLDFFFNDPDALITLSTIRGVPPTAKGRQLLKENGTLDPQVQEGVNIALSALGKPQTVWQMNSEIRQILDDIVEQFGFGVLSAEEAAEQLIKQLEAKLATL